MTSNVVICLRRSDFWPHAVANLLLAKWREINNCKMFFHGHLL